jgi:type II restriction enzyme
MVQIIVSIIFNETFFLELINSNINKPIGQLSGHNAGEPFCDKIYDFLKIRYPQKIYKQFEYLNSLYKKNLNAKTIEEKKKLLSPTIEFMISRGISTTQNWSVDNQFLDKQNDTADIIYVEKNKFNILDVKTTNIDKLAQPPNIISSLKLANICKSLLTNEDDEKLEINYIGIHWKQKKETLNIVKINVIDLFKITPSNLYINWAAALQIQFHISKVDQNFASKKKDWAKEYLKNFVDSAKRRIIKQKKDYVDVFLPFI